MPAVARLGDPIDCGDTIDAGSGNVFANGMPVTRVGPDLTAGHCYSAVPINSGSGTVFINNLPVARLGDPIPTHCCGPACHDGAISAASPNVFADG